MAWESRMSDAAAIRLLRDYRPTPDISGVVFDKARNVRKRMKELEATYELDLDLLTRKTSEAIGFICMNGVRDKLPVSLYMLEGFLNDNRVLSYDVLVHLEKVLNELHPQPKMNGHAQVNGHSPTPAPRPRRRLRLPTSLGG
jgi:hypothetical protein